MPLKNIRLALVIIASMFATAPAIAGNVDVGPGEYKQHFANGGERNIVVPKGETGTLEVQPGDTVTKRDPDTGEITYYDVK